MTLTEKRLLGEEEFPQGPPSTGNHDAMME